MLKLVIRANHMSPVLQTAVSSVGEGHLGMQLQPGPICFCCADLGGTAMHSHAQELQRQTQPFRIDRQLEELLHQARTPGAQHQTCQLNLWQNTGIPWALLSGLLDKA